MDYLTAPNPIVSLIHRTVEGKNPQCPYVWYDVRTVRPWTDFNISTLSAHDGLLELLNFKISASSFPNPSKANLNPENAAQLADVCAKHHAIKVNAALKVALGDTHLAMRALSSHGARQKPEFVSNYQSDIEHTIHGDGRGRVVGIVKGYDQWNSGLSYCKY